MIVGSSVKGKQKSQQQAKRKELSANRLSRLREPSGQRALGLSGVEDSEVVPTVCQAQPGPIVVYTHPVAVGQQTIAC